MKSKSPAFEDRMARLQEIVRILEEGNSSLEESLRLYKEGLEHAAACQKQLETARHDIKVCTEKGLEPFRDEEAYRETADKETDSTDF